MRKLLGSVLRDRELPFFKVAKKIATVQLFHDDVNIILILEDI